MAGFLTNVLGSIGGASQQQNNPLAGTQMEGIATSDDPNAVSSSAPGQTIQNAPQQPSFWQQHPQAQQAMKLLFGANPSPSTPSASMTQPAPRPPFATQPTQPIQPQQPAGNASGSTQAPRILPTLMRPVSGQPAGNAADPNGSTLNGVIQALMHPVSGQPQNPFSSNLSSLTDLTGGN